ncbi:MAG: shikimate dehydrogenase [Terriglobia bacterium]
MRKIESFGFLVHPLTIEDVAKKYKIANKAPKLAARVLKRRPPFVLSEIEGLESETGARARGWFVAVPLLPWQILDADDAYAIKKIVKAVKVAHKEGAGLVGLGAFTALVGGGGRAVAEEAEIPVTTGNTYTVVTAIDGIREATRLMGTDLNTATLAVVGASGSIGRVCAQILAGEVKEVRLIGRDAGRLEEAAKIVGGGNTTPVRTFTDVQKGIAEADIVISVSSAADALIQPNDIKTGAVVCDVARPRDVSARVVEVRDDVMVIDGGVVSAPGNVRQNFDLGMPDGLVEACIAETMILALEGRYESYTLGRDISLEKVQEMEGLARKHGFKLAGLRRFERALTPDEIDRIKQTAFAKS